MLEEKKEALRQISEIKHHLIDKQTFFPYNYNAMYVWSMIAILLTFTMVSLYEEGIVFGSFVVFGLVSMGFIAEGVMTKKVNQSYDIEDCTLRQRFIMHNFIMIAVFLIVLSATLASYKLYIPIYLSWLFLVSLGYFAVGYILNIPLLAKMAQFNIWLSIILLAIACSLGDLVGSGSNGFKYVQAAVILGLAIFPSTIAWKQKKVQ
jgi:hypothetical protein